MSKKTATKGFGMATVEAFKNIIGQESVITELDFYIESYKKSRLIPHVCLIAPKGCGKTTIGRATASALKSLIQQNEVYIYLALAIKKQVSSNFITKWLLS